MTVPLESRVVIHETVRSPLLVAGSNLGSVRVLGGFRWSPPLSKNARMSFASLSLTSC
jgi:hypothetical protein